MRYKKCINCKYNKPLYDDNGPSGDRVCIHPRADEICSGIYPSGNFDGDCVIEKFDDGTLFKKVDK